MNENQYSFIKTEINARGLLLNVLNMLNFLKHFKQIKYYPHGIYSERGGQ